MSKRKEKGGISRHRGWWVVRYRETICGDVPTIQRRNEIANNGHVSGQAVQFRDNESRILDPESPKAFISFGRSSFLPDSTSVTSAINFHRPPFK
jgi:hypothetical protein